MIELTCKIEKIKERKEILIQLEKIIQKIQISIFAKNFLLRNISFLFKYTLKE